ncbi:MAG: rhomboid family intramembrane serine protease [Bacteroidales bacterium]|nr:rhomboid family intramembrane serine protease [Bacteroidales bacterium]
MRQNLENIPDELFKRKMLLSMIVPLFMVILLWIVLFIEWSLDISLSRLGIWPLELRGLPGILLSPLLHADAGHLFNNTIPLLVLGTALFYFYSDVAPRVLAYIWIATGVLVWITARPAWHIGASGVVYGLASFLFVSGMIRRYFRLMALSLLIVFLYGSMVWGMFPFIGSTISYESHMLGAVTGVILALWYRNEGPQRPVPEWMNETDEEIYQNQEGNSIDDNSDISFGETDNR